MQEQTKTAFELIEDIVDDVLARPGYKPGEHNRPFIGQKATKKDMHMIMKLYNDDNGQDLIEYALIAALIALVAITALTSVGTKISDVLGQMASGI